MIRVMGRLAIVLVIVLSASVLVRTAQQSDSGELWVTSQGTDRLFIVHGQGSSIETIPVPGIGPHIVTFSPIAALLAIGPAAALRRLEPTSPATESLVLTQVADWSLEAQRAIVPPPAGVGNKFPGEAALYMGMVHAAIYDAAVALEGGFRPYALGLTAPADTSPAAAIAAAAHGVLVGLLPTQQADLDMRYADYLAGLPDGTAKTNGVALGEHVAAAVLAVRANDGREANPQYVQLTTGPGIFEPDPTRPVLGLRLSTIRPLALDSPWQFRPDGPNAITTEEYAADFDQVKELGRFDSGTRTVEQTTEALFWTDHDLRQWNEGMLRIAANRGLGLVQTARMLAMAHVSGGDAMIACFDAKYHYMFWRPTAALQLTDADGTPRPEPDATWRPLRPVPNHPEYPAAHTCHTGAIVEALRTFFGTDEVRLSFDSRTTGTTRSFTRLSDIVKEVEDARVYAGFHFRSSDQTGSRLGRDVARFVAARHFRGVG